MRYTIRVIVPGTNNVDNEADRLPGYSGEFSESERDDVMANLSSMAPQVEMIRDIYNDSLDDPGKGRASIEVFPLYDANDAIVDMVTNMPDWSLAIVPVEAIDKAPLTDAQKKTAYERRARIEVAKLPQEIQDVLPEIGRAHV